MDEDTTRSITKLGEALEVVLETEQYILKEMKTKYAAGKEPEKIKEIDSLLSSINNKLENIKDILAWI
jgi:hypothetical protein